MRLITCTCYRTILSPSLPTHTSHHYTQQKWTDWLSEKLLLHESLVTFNDTDIFKWSLLAAGKWRRSVSWQYFDGSEDPTASILMKKRHFCHIRHKANDTQAHVQRCFTCFPLNSPPLQTQPPSSNVSWKSGFTARPTADSYTCFPSLVVVWVSELSFLSCRPHYCVPCWCCSVLS